MARVRMGAMAVAFGIQHDLGLECVVHLTTRDRNLMALESELLGAHALGMRNVLALTGDPPRVGDYPTGTGVWDVDAIGLIRILARLNRGEDEGGAPIGQQAGFTIACALDPTARDAAREWDRLEQKVAAGAHLVMTQPLYSVAQVEAMLAEARRRFGPGGFPIPLILGVLPLQSSRHTEFLHHEVPGITIPDETRAAMRAAGDHGAEVGLQTSLDLLRAVGDAVAGTYVMPSFGRYEQAAELVRRLRAELPAARRRGGLTGWRAGSDSTSGRLPPGRSLAPSSSSRPSRRSPPQAHPSPSRLTASGSTTPRGSSRRRRSRTRRGRSPTSRSRPAPRSSSTRRSSPARPKKASRWTAPPSATSGGSGGRGSTTASSSSSISIRRSATGRSPSSAGPGFRAVYLDDAALQAVIDDTMLPYLRDGAFDRGLLAGLEKIVEATSPEAAAKLQAARQINSLVGLVVGPLLMILLAGLAFARWFRAGRDPVYLDSPSIYLPAPPDGLTAATGALLLDGRCSRRALTTALLDLASRDEIAIYRQDKAFAADPIGIQIRTPAVDDSRVRLNRRWPLGPAEAAVLSSLGRNASRNEANALVVEGKDLLTFGTSVAAFESALEDHAVAGRLFTAKPATVVARWTGIAVAEFVLAVVAVIGGASLPSSGLVLLGAWLAIAAVVTGLFARHQPARTKDGAMLRAMLLAYRRTLQASLREARSMEQVLAEPRLAWLQTPDRAVVWSTALDLGDEVQEVLDRTAALFVSGEARPGSLYAPWWYHSYGRGSVPGSAGFAPGLMSSSAVPDLSGMFSALGTIGNTPSSSGSSGGMGGGGGFSGGASGSF